ncbi:histone-lysine N-methyltransferase SETMAR [Trichonephila clavipes]|nr:histone-lysine N-methyltransferase SETMAR [Trichonephila clavipes]
MHIKRVEAQRALVGVVWKFEKEMPIQVSSLQLDHGSELRGSQTRNSELYCQHLDRLKLEIDQKWPELVNRRGVAFHQDSARSQTSVVSRQKLWKLGWEFLIHPQYSPDMAPSDYHLFLALQNFLSGKNWDQEKIAKIDYWSFSPIRTKTHMRMVL